MKVQQARAVLCALCFNQRFSRWVMSQRVSGAPPGETATVSASDVSSQMHSVATFHQWLRQKFRHQKTIKMTAHQSRRCRANRSSLELSIGDKYSKNTVGLPVPPQLITMLAGCLCDSVYSLLKPLTRSFCIVSSLKVVSEVHYT